ncbi:MAG: hypothetical protein MI867_19630 [Pseudomonadales bacterium]|nr:hypothetical protein [Pseudomonadales bacterium]
MGLCYSKIDLCLLGVIFCLFASVSVADDYDFLLNLDMDKQDLMSEPWQLSLEFNDAGVEGEGELREVFTVSKIGLFASDDYLNVSYETDSFEDFHSITFLYESNPLFGNWVASIDSFYSIEQLDVQDSDTVIDDIGMGVGLYLLNFYGSENWFLQWGFGARGHVLDSEDTPIYENGDKNEFFLPGLKLIFQGNLSENLVMNGYLIYEWNEPSVLDTKELEASADTEVPFFPGQFVTVNLTADIEARFQILNAEYKATYTFLENAQEQSKISARLMGFTSFNDALLPQFQKSVGGLYSVRGYDDQIQSGDRVLEASLEWAVHASSFELSSSEFSLWCFVFTDWAEVNRSEINVQATSQFDLLSANRRIAERDIDIASWGLGIDLYHQGRSSFNLAWARALKDDKLDTEAGDDRLHAYLRFHF